jgi:hypothetical protein
VNLRFNLDAFNAFNVQGLNNPGNTSSNNTDGVEQVAPGGVGASSHNGPRELQFTLRLSF